MQFSIPHSKPFVDGKDRHAVADAVMSRMHATGAAVTQFEETLRNYSSMKYAKAATSGTAALFLALSSLIKKGDEVILPSYVCQSVLSAVHHAKGTPILADIRPDFSAKGYNLSAETIEPHITKKTKAVILPHMFGNPADVSKVISLGIPVIEDCAQSLGAEYHGKQTGSFGALSVFSFYGTKVISTGHGGMIVTSSSSLANELKDITTYDGREQYRVSYNLNMTNIQAALGLSQFAKLPFFIQRRRAIGKKYDAAFAKAGISFSKAQEGAFPFRYIVQTDSVQELEPAMRALHEKGIGASKPVFNPLHRSLKLPARKFMNTEQAQNTALSIPIYPALSDKEVSYIIRSVINIMG